MKNPLLYFIKMYSTYFLVGIVAQSLLYTLVIAGETNAQVKSIEDVTINIGLENASFQEFIDQVEQQTEFTFFFEKAEISGAQTITLQAKDRKLAEVLRDLSKTTGLSFRQVNHNIGIFKNDSGAPVIIEDKQDDQARTVTGQVTADDDGSPIPGATVMVQGTTNGTVTDIDGRYTLTFNDPNAVLIFSYVGYLTEQVPVENRSVVDISLMIDITQLGEVVVVGYGTQSRQNLTGSVAKVSADQLKTKPVPSVEAALQGQVSGVTVTNTGGPGTAPTVRIRGVGSVNYGADPLYVVDGVPLGNLNNFSVNDIASVSVLKDASAAAIYGSRAANGVIIITTKTGSISEKNTLSIDASYGWQKVGKTLDLLNNDQYLEFGTELLTNAGLELPYRFTHMNEPIYPGATQSYEQTHTDWQEEMFETAPIAQLNVSFSGGNEKTRFFTSYNRFAQEGVMRGTDYNRHSFRINADSRLGKFITIGENVKVSYSEMARERVSGGRTMIKHIVNQAPWVPVYNPTNNGGFGGAQGTDGSDAENPVRIAELETDQSNIVNFLGNVYAEVDFTDWLSFRSSLGVEYTSDRNIIRLPIFNEGANSRTRNELTDNRFTFYSPVITNQVTIDKNFGKHGLNVVLVAEQQKRKLTRLNGRGWHANNQIDVLDGSEEQALNGNRSLDLLQSYVGRVNYSFDSKYLVSASIRRDGSSVFAPGNKIGYFPAASLGWVISRERFLENSEVISNLKLRASYGTVGFNALGSYPWQSVISTSTAAVFNNTASGYTGAYFDGLANRELEWEITEMSNFGFDLELLDNSVTLSADYFIRQTDNLIVQNPLPTSMGYAGNPNMNVGSMKNWGYEFTAGYNKTIGEFDLGIEGNISFVNNEVIALSGAQPTIDIGAVTGDYGGYIFTRTEEGEPIQGFFGWQVEGIFQSQEEIDALNPDPSKDIYYQTENTRPGDIKFRDLNDDGVITEDDRTYLGSYLPDFSYGLNLSAGYKGFNLSMLVQGVQGNEIYNGTKVLTQGMTRLFNAETEVLNAWTPDNRNTDIPRAVSGDPNGNARTSDRFVEDGSYMRIKNVTLGYTLPENTLASIFNGAISNVNVYVTAQNLLTFTKYSGYDPEVGYASNYSGGGNANLIQGVDFGFPPQPRTFILGLNVSF